MPTKKQRVQTFLEHEAFNALESYAKQHKLSISRAVEQILSQQLQLGARYFLSKNSQSLEIKENALIVKDLLLKKNELTIRDLKRTGRTQLKKLSDAQLKSIFRSLVESGLAQYVTGRKTLKIKNKSFSDSADSCSSEALTNNALTSLNGIDNSMTAPVSYELESLSNGHSEQSIIIDSLLTIGDDKKVCLPENSSKFEVGQKVDLVVTKDFWETDLLITVKEFQELKWYYTLLFKDKQRRLKVAERFLRLRVDDDCLSELPEPAKSVASVIELSKNNDCS